MSVIIKPVWPRRHLASGMYRALMEERIHSRPWSRVSLQQGACTKGGRVADVSVYPCIEQLASGELTTLAPSPKACKREQLEADTPCCSDVPIIRGQ